MITIHNTMDWVQNKLYNPITKYKIKLNSKTYKMFENKYKEYFPNNYSYIDSIEDRDAISFEIFWTETNGIKKMVYDDLTLLKLYKDNNNIVHCFEKNTLDYMKHYKITYHPITMETLPIELFENRENININTSISSQAKDIFNTLTNISIFIDSNMFLKLNNLKIDKLYYETRDFYQNNLPENIKNKLNIFIKSCNEYNNMNFKNKQEYILDCYKNLLKSSENEIVYMYYYIIVGGLSTVIPEIKELYPDIIYGIMN